MTAVYPEIDPRVARWMSRRGRGLRLSAAAALLLAPRLRVRWRAGVVSAVAVLAFYVWWFPVAIPLSLHQDPDWPFAPFVQASVYLVMTAVVLAFVWFTRWRDRLIAAELPLRVTRTGAVGVRTVLGTAGCVAVAAAGVVHLVILVVLARNWPAAVSLSYAGGLLVVTAAMLVVLRAVLRRPTVALDDSSLAIDERLRAQDAMAALTPWWFIDTATAGGLPPGHGSTAISLIWLGFVPVLAFYVATQSDPFEGTWWRR